MFKVLESYDVYRIDLLKKYGSKEYWYYGDYNSTTTKILKEFVNQKEAVEFAETTYNSLNENYKINISGNNIYLIRIDVLNYENEDDPKSIDSFGMSLEEYEKLSNYPYNEKNI